MSVVNRPWLSKVLLAPLLAIFPHSSLLAVDPPEPPAVTGMLPANTAFTVLIDTTDSTWSSLSQFELFALISELSGTEPHLPFLPFVPVDIDYATSVAPWVGDTVALAILPAPDPQVSITMPEQMVMVAPLQDVAAFKEFWQLLGTTLDAPEEQTHQGVTIWYWEDGGLGPEPFPGLEGIDDGFEGSEEGLNGPEDGIAPKADVAAIIPNDGSDIDIDLPAPDIEVEPWPSSLAIAVLPDQVLMAHRPEALKQLIDVWTLEQPTLADYPAFLQTLDTPYADTALVHLYGNLAEMSELNFQTLDTLDLPLPVPVPTPDLPAFDLGMSPTDIQGTVAGVLSPQAEGLRLQGRVYYGQSLPILATPSAPDADNLFTLAPAPTYGLISSRNFAGQWDVIATVLEAFDLTRSGLDQVRQGVEDWVGLDLDEEVIRWMDGEYALLFYPTDGGVFEYILSPNVKLGVGLLFQTSDPAAAEYAMAALDDAIADWSIDVNSRDLNGAAVTSWEFPSGDISFFSHGWPREDTLALTTGVEAMAELVNPQPYEPLAEHSTFRHAIDTFPQPNNGYGYVNFGSTLSAIFYALPVEGSDPFMQTVRQFLGTLYSFSVTSSSTRDYAQFDVLLGLAPKQE